MYYYAAYKTPSGEFKQGVYTAEDYHRVTFSPETTVYYVTDLKPKTKEAARAMVLDISDADMNTVNNNGDELSYGELSIIYELTEQAARRFGLVREFRENGII